MTEDRAYSAHRAEQELRLAEAATRPEVVRAHYELANLHLDRASDAPRERRPIGRRRVG